MLRHLLVLSQSGLVLFLKDFVKTVDQPRLLGSLLTAMTEFSMHSTGMKPTFIELSSLAVTLVHDDGVRLICCLVHDRNDSSSFGRLIASEILTAFIEEYSADRLKSSATLGHNLKDFSGFDAKIAGIVQNSVRPVLEKLQAHHGVITALLITEETIIQATGSEVDQLAVLAHVEAILSHADAILDIAWDGPKHVLFDDEHCEVRTHLWRVFRCKFLVCISLRLGSNVYDGALEHAVHAKSLISQVIAFTDSNTNFFFLPRRF